MDEPTDPPPSAAGEGALPRRAPFPTGDMLPTAVDIDRGAIGSVGNSRRAAIVRGGAFAAATAVVGMFFITQSGPRHRKVESSAERRAEASPAKEVVDYAAVAATPAPTLARAANDPNAPKLLPGSDYPPAGEPIVPAIPSGAAPADPGKARGLTLADAARRAPLMAFGAQETGRTGQPDPRTLADQGSATSLPADKPAQQDADPLEVLRQHAAVRRSPAAMIGDRNYLLTAGTVIPCVLQTALNSAQPGYVTCVLPRDVYSDNGRVVLMEKGTRVLGEYHGSLNNGQNRLFALWTRAETPRGVVVDLASPASDALGRAGIAGGVDTFFWARFGSAIMLSLIDDGMEIAGAALQNRGTNTTQVPGQAAGIALQTNINIHPVLKKNQGEEVSIFVAQDFDFSGVYHLSLEH